ncbi:hypothetical protein PPL_00325 [Heterostelium album PN500]|uniref:Uncharacterized protein n=1 Tax=Heterostelium pallidum (strain ATCC 26659 / Pp 5 / PN500) TaxID=670386 RepID=D3AW56_HETP5|nr:hypothetical protein PPL_00325 [Heterostelium album PN500]EFA86529.1 hypothetical protein PPL_00325 [Heterostelium album PN500]|eukprot:XP_020438634.1 hypothetical protein PPL_00325 [Heterostelium album PN500]
MASIHKNEKNIKKSQSKPSISTEEKGNYPVKDGIVIHDADQRKKIHSMLMDLGNIMSTSDWTKLDEYLEPKAVLNRINEEIIGRISIQEFLSKKNKGILKYFFNRFYYDSEKMLVCSEWITRRKKEKDQYYHEKMVVWFMKLSKENTIKTWYIWRDPFYSRFIEYYEPISEKCWMRNRKPPKKHTASEMCDFVRKKFSYLENADIGGWSGTLHKDVEIRPPWRVHVGKDDCVLGLKKFLNDFEDIGASILEILYDYTQPNVAIYIQLFGATKRDNKERCEDIDLSMIMLEDEQIKYWRCYFYEKDIPENHFSFIIFIKDS